MSKQKELSELVKGLHHITLVTANEEVNRRFYTEVLGLRRVKLSVNQDDIFHRHLYYADENGTTGSAITFFEWPELPRGEIGLGSPHHLAYTLPKVDAIPKWKAWLDSKGVSVTGPYVRDGRVSLYLRDPDGVNVEIASPNSEEKVSQDYLKEEIDPKNLQGAEVKEIEPSMRLTKFNHASPITSDSSLTARFLDKLVGLKNSFTRPNPDQEGTSIMSVGNADQPDFLRYLASNESAYGEVGRGNIHHIALAVDEDEDQLRIMRRLNDAGFRNSGIIDRFWFHSLYFHDPDGNLLEIATKGPGYTADEPLEKLGSKLVLPAWLEPRRKAIESALSETDSKNHGTWPPEYPRVSSPPESLVAVRELRKATESFA